MLHAGKRRLSMEQLAEIIGSCRRAVDSASPDSRSTISRSAKPFRRPSLSRCPPKNSRTGSAASLPIFCRFYRFIVGRAKTTLSRWPKVLDKEKTVRRQRGLQKGDKVRIVRGMLAGEDGAVAEADAKGQLKVIVGKMVIKIDASDVERANA